MHVHTFVVLCTRLWWYAHLLFFGNSVNGFHQIVKWVYNLKINQQCLTEDQEKKLRFREMSTLVFIFGCWQWGSPESWIAIGGMENPLKKTWPLVLGLPFSLDWRRLWNIHHASHFTGWTQTIQIIQSDLQLEHLFALETLNLDSHKKSFIINVICSIISKKWILVLNMP